MTMSQFRPHNSLTADDAQNATGPPPESFSLPSEYEKAQSTRNPLDPNIEGIRGPALGYFPGGESNRDTAAHRRGIFSDTSSITIVRDYGASLREGRDGDAKHPALAHRHREDGAQAEEVLMGIIPQMPLEEQLGQKLVRSVTDEAKIFLPASDLDEVICYETVRHFLESGPESSFFLGLDLGGGSALPGNHDNSLELLTRYICGEPSGKASVELRAARKIFASLLLIGKARAIVDFLQEGVYDEDLPLDRMNEKGMHFDLGRKGQKEPQQPLQCFRSWRRHDIVSFDANQWYMKAPFFAMKDGRPAFYTLEHRTILPWQAIAEPVSTTDFSIVRRVEIHPAHHRFFSDKECGSFALKELKSHKKDDFDLEVAALKKIEPHPHLIKLLTTFSYQGRYYLLLGWAEGGNLQDLWEKHHPKIRADRSWVLWLAEQCKGLAEGLRGIHNTKLSSSHESGLQPPILDEKNCGRHGDIKPQNVLWFRQEKGAQGDHGVLKISDFGLTRFHSAITTKVSPNGIPVSQTYKAPEIDLNEDLSRPFDVWSLGCLYLEFITWILTGWEGLHGFDQSRFAEKDSRTKFNMDLFYNLNRHQGATTATVKTTVINRMDDLKAEPACSPFLSEFLDYIQASMLVIDKTKRDTSSKVSQKLDTMYKKCQENPKYCFSYVYSEHQNHVVGAASQADEDMAGISFTSEDVPTFSFHFADDDMATAATSEQKRKRDSSDVDMHTMNKFEERRKRSNTYPRA